MLRILSINRITKSYELQVKQHIREIIEGGNVGSLQEFKTALENRIKTIKRQSTALACHCYRCDISEKNATVWHLNTKGEPDRLVAEIVVIN